MWRSSTSADQCSSRTTSRSWWAVRAHITSWRHKCSPKKCLEDTMAKSVTFGHSESLSSVSSLGQSLSMTSSWSSCSTKSKKESNFVSMQIHFARESLIGAEKVHSINKANARSRLEQKTQNRGGDRRTCKSLKFLMIRLIVLYSSTIYFLSI